MSEGGAIAGSHDIDIAGGTLLSEVVDDIGDVVSFVGVAGAVKIGPGALVGVFRPCVPATIALRIHSDVSRRVDT